MSIMNILALDLGTHTGWALYLDGQIVSGVQDFSTRRFDGGGMRFLKFVNWLSDVRQKNAISSVYYEEVRRHLGTDAAHIYGGFMAHLTTWCELRDIPCDAKPVGTIKKHATGRGNANKDLMMAAATSRGWNPLDDNEADALWLLDLVLDELGVPKHERKVG